MQFTPHPQVHESISGSEDLVPYGACSTEQANG